METKEIIQALRTKQGLSQNELAERVHVTRQAVSRWENGETTPGLETLKRLSQLFDDTACRVTNTPLPARSRTARSTRTTASGAIPAGSLPMPTRHRCWTFWWPICPIRSVRRRMCAAHSSTAICPR